jgi:TetR/AcrR family transcriptional repressor of nem operon
MSSKAEVVPSAIVDTSTASRSTRDRLIDVGLEQMRKHGYGATGLQELLRAADVPKGSFYHHFGSKEEFTAAVIERYYTLALAHCQQVFGNVRQAPLKRLRRYFEELIQFAGQAAPIPGCLLGSLSLEVARVSPLLQGNLSSSFKCWQTIVAWRRATCRSRLSLRRSQVSSSIAGKELYFALRLTRATLH